jgi:ribose/xylose/arabinose/galactoside ABC-type transport system permease subunit
VRTVAAAMKRSSRGGETATRSTGARVVSALRINGIWLALLALLMYALVAVPDFASTGNIADLLRAMPALGIVAVGQTFVIVAGGLDLSVGALASLVSVLSVGLVSQSSDLVWVLLLAPLLGLFVGAAGGSAVAFSGANPVILTFGMLSLLSGATYMYTQESVGETLPALRWVDEQLILGVIPVSAVLLIVVTLAAWVAFARSPFGLHVQALGGSEAGALRSGIRVRRIKIAVYMISGLSAAIAGLLLAARLGTGYPLAGQGLELSAVVAVIIGGTPFGGGRGTILGSIGGVVLLSMLANVLNLQRVSPDVQQIITGGVVIIAVTLYSIRRPGR